MCPAAKYFSLLLVLAWFPSPSLLAHPVHQSQAEVSFNATTRRLEVSLTVFINDLELALSQHAGTRMSLEQTPAKEFDAQIQSYLAQTFLVKKASGEAAPIRWLGRKLNAGEEKGGDPALTLFFEVPLSENPGSYALQHEVFCGIFEDQSNLLRLNVETQKTVWCFLRGDGAKKLPWPEPSH